MSSDVIPTLKKEVAAIYGSLKINPPGVSSPSLRTGRPQPDLLSNVSQPPQDKQVPLAPEAAEVEPDERTIFQGPTQVPTPEPRSGLGRLPVDRNAPNTDKMKRILEGAGEYLTKEEAETILVLLTEILDLGHEANVFLQEQQTPAFSPDSVNETASVDGGQTV